MHCNAITMHCKTLEYYKTPMHCKTLEYYNTPRNRKTRHYTTATLYYWKMTHQRA